MARLGDLFRASPIVVGHRCRATNRAFSSSLTLFEAGTKLCACNPVSVHHGQCVLVPSLDADIHLVLCRFGRAGLAYIETDPAEADATTVVQNLLHGRYGWPLRVIALNVDEGWSRDVSEAMARKVHEIAEREDYELTEGTLAFMEAHSPRVVQPTLPLW